MKKSIVRRDIPQECERLIGVPLYLERIYWARGVRQSSQLDLNLKAMLNPAEMRGMRDAVKLLTQALEKNAHVMIVGDFDADGATSTALAVHALRSFGLNRCSFLVPNRFEFGYGLTPEIVDLAAESEPDLIITVDNGISSIEGVKRAESLNIPVLITDHHLPGDDLPQAAAIINPNQPGCQFPSKNTAGVAVIFYLLTALRAELRQNGWFAKKGVAEPSMAEYLDLVALGTVADLVPLDRNNRILVEQGLRRIRAGKCRPGIKAILDKAGRSIANVVASDLGFFVGPRLNAAGRLDDMSVGINCLLSETESAAMQLAGKLDALNTERKQIETEMKQDAVAHLDNIGLDEGNECWGICLYEPHWHQGVIGILASRIKERLHRPAIVFAPASDDPDNVQEIKGSARSIPGLHMRDTLDLIAKRKPDLLQKFGGHAMAAGLTIPRDRYDEFAMAFDEAVREALAEDDLEAKVLTDGPLPPDALSEARVRELQRSGPWGQQFPEPLFDDNFSVVQSRVLKDKHLKMVLRSADGNQMFDAIQFNSDWVDQPLPDEVRIVYRPDVNEFRGRTSVQLLVDYIEAP